MKHKKKHANMEKVNKPTDEKRARKPKKGHSKKVDTRRFTPEEQAEFELKRQQIYKEEHERKEQEKYLKYISKLREQNYRAALLSDPLKSIIAMKRAHILRRREQLAAKKWENYLSCSRLPNVLDSPGLRAFIYQWQTEIEEDIKNWYSWVLQVDEESLLTQDLDKRNCCFWKLYKEQPVIGDHYTPRIEECHTLLNELEFVLRDNYDPDLKEIKIDLRAQLLDVMDKFTCRILSNVERDMSRIDACFANLNFASKYFSVSLWTTRPVPQLAPAWKKEGALTEIKFGQIDATLIIPSQIETDGFSFRGLLMQYDHLSDTTQSSKLECVLPLTPDLRTSNEMEWNKREEIMHAKLEIMKEDRATWEKKELDKSVKEEEAKKSKTRKPESGPKPKHRHKPVRFKPPPAMVTETTVVDVTEDYLQYEEDLLLQQRNDKRPAALNLAENEINLREFHMYGGVYAFHYLKRPPQYTQPKYQLLYKIDTRQVLQHANFTAINEHDLVEIDLKLSTNVNWWVAPIACYWQPWEESDEFESLSPELKNFHINYDKHAKKLENLLFTEREPKTNYSIVKCFKDFTLDVLPNGIDFHKLMRDYIVPRMPTSFKFKVEMDAETEIIRKEALRVKEAAMDRSERNEKRRASFNSEMKAYLEQINADFDDTVTKMQDEGEIFYESERQRLMNHGENELMIDRYIRHLRIVDAGKIQDLHDDAMSKYNDYVEDQFKIRILAVEAEDQAAAAPAVCNVRKSEAEDLFPAKTRQLPFKLVDEDTVYSFNVPNENDPPGHDEELSDDMLLSTFLRYLIFLFEKSQPFFPEIAKVEVVETDPIESVSLKRDTSETKSPKSPIKKLSSPTKSKRKKSAKRKSASLVSSARPNSSNSTDSSRSEKVEKNNPGRRSSKKRSRSGKKRPRSRTSKKNSKSPPSKKRSSSRKKTTVIVDSEIPSQLDTVMKHSTTTVQIKKKQGNILQLIPHLPGKWVRSGINVTDFNAETNVVKLQISRFGTIGFALPIYCNFPFKYWELYPNGYKKHSVILKIIGNYVEVKIEITDEGYLIERIEPNNINFIPHKVAINYNDLKHILINNAINIFPNRDAEVYIDGMIEKHRAMEDHTYYCFAQFTLSHYFRWSKFNRLSNYRKSFVEFYEMRDDLNIPNEFTEIMVTPERCNFVVASEVTPKTGDIYIDYKLQPKEQEFYPDIYNMLMANCNEQSLKYHEQMKKVHRFNVARLLCAVRPLSFA